MPDVSAFTQPAIGVLAPEESERTNSLIIARVPTAFFQQPQLLDLLRDHFETFGEINQWAPMPSFTRIIVVFYHEEAAERAKRTCDPLVLEHNDAPPTIMRVYRSDPNPIISDSSNLASEHFLRPPALEKNFLISPPGSPPVGWEPIREDPPNVAPLADDLIAALRKLQLREKRRSREVLLEPEEGVGVGVYVEDCDADVEGDEAREEDWEYGAPSPARLRWRPVATAMPPIPAA